MLAAALAGTLVAPATASAAPTGTTSLAEVLAADGNRLDRDWDDFDLVDRAVRIVLRADANSPVAVLADGETPLTAFVPTDRAFRRLVNGLTGRRPATERATLRAVRSVADAQTLETVLLYHVVPGSTVRYATARQADGARLDTAQGAKLTVNVRDGRVLLRDRDPDAPNASVIRSAKNLNKGSRQIAHGIDGVLRPLDL
jgi:uncharacterized surface protein with fasciclin (FAS1) repeats